MANLARLYIYLCPGEYGPSVIQRVLLEHRFLVTSFKNTNVHKKVHEDFINHILGGSVTRAAQILSPLYFIEVNNSVKDLNERRVEVTRMSLKDLGIFQGGGKFPGKSGFHNLEH